LTLLRSFFCLAFALCDFILLDLFAGESFVSCVGREKELESSFSRPFGSGSFFCVRSSWDYGAPVTQKFDDLRKASSNRPTTNTNQFVGCLY
jgi:hypothetical protein